MWKRCIFAIQTPDEGMNLIGRVEQPKQSCATTTSSGEFTTQKAKSTIFQMDTEMSNTA